MHHVTGTTPKFADWLRGTPKLLAGTAEEWDNWKKTAKVKKFRYWLTEEGLDYLQDFICWPINKIKAILNYINNRWVVKRHALTSTLKRGEYYDLDYRLLHAVFDELINFVEVELAWMCVVFSDEERKKYKVPWYRSFLRISLWRSPEAGIAYLKWAAELKFNENWIDKNDPNFGLPTPQALAAQETLLLYQWWKHDRSNRLDPSDASGWSEYCEKHPSILRSENSQEDKQKEDILNIYHNLEKEHADEDTAMLIRLIKIRHHLWT